MKRGLLMALALLLLALPAAADENDGPPYGPGWGGGMGPGWHMGPGMMGGFGPGGCGMGPGMMGGFGPGMMGHGPGGWHMGPGMMGGFGPGMMGGPGMGYAFAQLPPEKREQLQKLHFEHMQAMLPMRAEVQQRRLALAEALHAYPLEQATARERYEAVNAARAELFGQMTAFMAQVQELLGEELWTQLHSGWGPGFGPGGTGPGAGRMSPGMMGPSQR